VFGDDDGSGDGVGIVQIVYGGPDGLSGHGSNAVSLAMTGVSAPSLSFGDALEAGDIDGDRYDDLAVGAPDYNCNASDCVTEGGDVAVFAGSPDGLTGAGSQAWSQDSPGVLDEGETNDQFGASLKIADFDADGYGDLAIGSPGEEVTGAGDGYGQGAVAVLYGTAMGISAERNQRWHEDTPGVPGQPQSVGLFGDVLASGDFDGDGADDLAIGARFHDVGKASGAGSAVAMYGSAGGGLTAARAQRWSQASAGIPSAPEEYDEFGTALAAADFGRSGRDDLAIGAPGEQVGKVWRAGMVNVLYGRSTGLSGTDAQGWSQASPGVLGRPEQYDSFGSSLTP
jgi:hypothetical protein